jgi:hypothetical protein
MPREHRRREEAAERRESLVDEHGQVVLSIATVTIGLGPSDMLV